MPKVSVIVPVYNVEAYLKTALDSLLRQTLKDIEFICVNDGSTDGSAAILEEYAGKDSRIVLVSKQNEGYGKAMNIGLDRASGEYVGILEPDDYVALTMFEDLYEIAAENDLDWVKADFYRFTTDREKETMTFCYSHLSADPSDYRRVFKPVERKSSFLYLMNTWSGIYRLSFLREHGIRHHETPGASFQDNGFWFQTFMFAERAMILDTPYYRVRRDNPGSSVHNPGKVYAINREYDYIRGILAAHPEYWEQLKGVYWRVRYLNYEGTLRRIDRKFVRDYLADVSKELQAGYSGQEFSRMDFPDEEWKRVLAIMEKPGTVEPLPDPSPAGELELLKNSRSYKLGRFLTFIPRKLRNLGKSGTP